MNNKCSNNNHDYENNKIDCYICKKCGDKILFSELDEAEDKFINLDF